MPRRCRARAIRWASVGPRHLRYDRLDVGGGAINGGKPSIGFIEDEVEIGPRQHHRFDTVMALEPVGDLAQFGFIFGRNLASRRQAEIDAMDLIDLLIPWTDDVDRVERPEQSSIDREAGAEQGHA